MIEQAKGMLSAQAGTDVATAFTLLRTHARRTGTALTAMATAVVTGAVHAADLERAAADHDRV